MSKTGKISRNAYESNAVHAATTQWESTEPTEGDRTSMQLSLDLDLPMSMSREDFIDALVAAASRTIERNLRAVLPTNREIVSGQAPALKKLGDRDLSVSVTSPSKARRTARDT